MMQYLNVEIQVLIDNVVSLILAYQALKENLTLASNKDILLLITNSLNKLIDFNKKVTSFLGFSNIVLLSCFLSN